MDIVIVQVGSVFVRWDIKIFQNLTVTIVQNLVNLFYKYKACFDGVGPDENNKCKCDDGFKNVACVECTNDEGCTKRLRRITGDDSRISYCDSSFIPQKMRFYTCEVLGIIFN
jgi:hypothetical protein